MGDMMQELFDDLGYEDWYVSEDGAVLTCPHGESIESDGRAEACGCVSPLLGLGMI